MNNPIDLKCLSVNIRGLNKSLKRRTVFRWLHNQHCPFVFLQETYSSKECENIWQAEWGGEVFFSHGTKHSKGTMILINPKIKCKVENKICDKNGRYIILDILIADTRIVLANIYSPNDANQQISFFKEIQQQLQEFSEEIIIIGGDFNCTLAEKDKKGGNTNNRKHLVVEEIKKLCSLYDLNDIWRVLNPEAEEFTWRNKSFKIQCRLDFFLIPKTLNDLTDKCKIFYAPETDHSAILIHIKSDELKHKRGPGFWKFNLSFLKDEAYVSKLRTEIPNFQLKYEDIEDLCLKWDLIKMEIRGFTVKYSKNQAKQRKSMEIQLQKQINELYKKAETHPNNKQIIHEIHVARSRLKNIMQYKTKGTILRSKVRWHEHGERNTRYFYGLEKRNFEKKTTTKLKLPNGSLTTDQSEILQEQMHFYKALYTSNNHESSVSNNDLPLFTENITPLENADKLSCEGKVTQAECLKALKDFKNEKSPGTDGLQAEFYKYFWKELHADMIRSFNFAYDNGSLSISQRRGIITLIPKPNKDTALLDNLRPISLLNTDYKILTKAIAKRLEKVLPKVINPDQTGYIKNRYIGENIRLISDIMTYTEEQNIPGIALFIDFKKAFDTIEWDFINCCLKAFNFGPDIQNWVKILYNNVSSCIVNNGFASEFFPLERGVRQGCPLSGLLFVIGIELLARAIKNDDNIKGINVGEKVIKVSLYADDTTVFVQDLDSVAHLLTLLQKFKNLSGLEINTTKTEGMWLGRWKNKSDMPFGFRWPRDPIKALGIFFSYDKNKTNELNFAEKIRNLEKTLNSWKKRNLTLYGKINIVKTFGLSKLIYNASVLVIPEHFIKETEKLIFDFIWDGKPAKIKKSTIIGEKKQGGLKMIDFNIMNKALKVAWIPRLQTRSDASWKIIPEAALENLGGISFLSQCNYDVKFLPFDNLPDFYSDILKYWQNTRFAFQKNTSPRNEIIWNNHNIIIDGKAPFYKSWLEKNILRVEDLLDNNGNFLPFNLFSEKFHLETPFTLYFGLINSVPSSWKLAIKRTPPHVVENENNETKISTKCVYSVMLKKVFKSPTAESKVIRYGFTQDNIHKVYELPFQIKSDIKITMFQYKIIHNILPTKVSLFKAKICGDDICPQCLADRHSLDHMLLRCQLTVSFWNLFQTWWTSKTKENVTLTESMILYGIFDNREHLYSLNYSLLIAKYSIYSSCLQEKKLCFDCFLTLLREKINIQREIAVRNNNLTNFNTIYRFLL